MSSRQKKFLKNNLSNIFLVSIIFLLFSFAFQKNYTDQQSVLISKYQNKLEELKDEEKILKANVLANIQLKDLENIANQLGFEKIEKIKYIQVNPETFALKIK